MLSSVSSTGSLRADTQIKSAQTRMQEQRAVHELRHAFEKFDNLNTGVLPNYSLSRLLGTANVQLAPGVHDFLLGSFSKRGQYPYRDVVRWLMAHPGAVVPPPASAKAGRFRPWRCGRR